MSYTMLALFNLKLRQSKAKFDDPSRRSDLAAFWSIKEYVEALPQDTLNITTIPLIIKNEVFASKMYSRVLEWGKAMANCTLSDCQWIQGFVNG